MPSESPLAPAWQTLLAQIDRIAPPRAWDARIPPFPWGDPRLSERLLREHLSQAHDLASRRASIIEAQVAWLEDYLPSRSVLLDGGCGPGLHALALARLGHRVTGVDIGPAVVRYAQEQAAQGLNATFAVADLLTLALDTRFDVTFVLYGHLHTFRPEEAWRLLRRLRQHLLPGGRLLLEARMEANWDRSTYRNWWRGENDLFGPASYLALYDHVWDEEAAAEVERYQILHADGSFEQYALTERYLTENEWRVLLESIGFGQVRFIREGWPSETPGGWMLIEATNDSA
ncbi:MAG: class I SAM-dependent methyltransferase [Ardenticatenales bacterium]|nr:class I SAM-dependent methyltransferase [Ardenticatenales bacterium]